jgi:hypothetical protein
MVDESPSDQGLVHPRGEILLYVAPGGQVSLDVRLETESVWLSQAQMAELFGRERSVITRHVDNVFREGELPEPCNVHFLHAFGSDRPVLHRHLIQGLASHHQHVTLNWLATS